MARTFKLNDLQLILLTTAAQRADRNIYPAPDSVGGQGARIRNVVTTLVKQRLVDEIDVTDVSQAWREAEGRSIGLIINAAGQDAIGLGTQPPAEAEAAIVSADKPAGSRAGVSVACAAAVSPGRPAGGATPREGTKQALVLGLLRRGEGATLDQLVAATSWLPHTTRAALTGLRKKGHTLVKSSRDGATVYNIAAAA